MSAYLGEAKFNAAEAARIAGYRNDKQAGYELKRQPEVAEAIKQHLDAAAMTADEVLWRLAEQGRGDIADFLVLEETGQYWRINLNKAAEVGKLHLLKSITWEKSGPKIELYDAQAALVHLGRHHKLFTDRTETKMDEQDRNAVDTLNSKLAQLAARIGTPAVPREPDAGGSGGA